MRFKPGTKVFVRVNGTQHMTTVDASGVQRFKSDPLLKRLVDTDILCLNRLAVCTKAERTFPPSWRRKIYLNIGYSVVGYGEVFPQDEIENPLWDKESEVRP